MIRFFGVLAALALLASCSSSPETSIEKRNLWEAGTGSYAYYRIPAIAVARDGSILTFCEARLRRGGDWGPTDIQMRRTDGYGKPWDAPRIIAHVSGEIQPNPVAVAQHLTQAGEVTYHNPVPIVDRDGTIHFLFGVEYARVFYMRSNDDGRTFSAPVEITPAIEEFRRDYDWKVVATGPGHGIQLENGRLIVPVWLSTGTGGGAHRPSVNSVIYSDDHGATWHRGDIAGGPDFPKNPSETDALQLADGRVMLNMRNESPEHRRAVSYSQDGATGWSKPVFQPELIEPICMAGLIRLSKTPESDRNRILFVNPDSTQPADPERPHGNFARQNLTIRLSYDEGRTWPVKRAIDPGPSGYSDIAIGPGGAIHVFYESGAGVRTLTLATFHRAWITGGK